MANWLKTAALVGGGMAVALTFAAPAEAQRYDRYRHYDRGGDVATGAIIGGVVGLGIGAAIASSNRDRYYRGGYYDRRYYGPRRGYWRNDYRYRHHYRPYRGYYRDRWAHRGNRWNCVRRVYDPYIGRTVRVRVC